MIDLMPNGTILYQWILFMIAFAVLHFGIFKPALRILEIRRERTRGEKEKAHSLDIQSQDMLSQCEKKVEEARHVGMVKRDQIRSIGEKYVEELLKNTREEMEARLDRTRELVERESKEASFQLRQYTQGLAKDIVTKVLEREI